MSEKFGGFEYNPKKPLEVNQADFNSLDEEEKAKIIARDKGLAENEDTRRAVQGQDIATAKRAAESGGTELEKLYAGFFGSQENCEAFARLIPEDFYSRENLVIVDAGSSKGTLAHYMGEECKKRGKEAKLIMVDTNSVAMAESPVRAEKITGDLLENPLPNETADLVILRSVLQYMNDEDQAKLLEGLRKNLKPGGILVSQFGSYDTQEQAEAFNKLFDCAKRPVNFCGKQKGIELHEAVFGEIAETSEGPTLFETFDDFFVRRIEAPEDQKEAAKKYLAENVEKLGNVLTSKEDPYAWQIPYTIVRCEKGEKLEQ